MLSNLAMPREHATYHLEDALLYMRIRADCVACRRPITILFLMLEHSQRFEVIGVHDSSYNSGDGSIVISITIDEGITAVAGTNHELLTLLNFESLLAVWLRFRL